MCILKYFLLIRICLTIHSPGTNVPVVAIVVILAIIEIEEKLFGGSCTSLANGGCDCVLPANIQQAADAWKNEPLPPPEIVGDLCQAKCKGGEFDHCVV